MNQQKKQNCKKILKKLNIKAEILTWKGKKPKTNIQSSCEKKKI